MSFRADTNCHSKRHRTVIPSEAQRSRGISPGDASTALSMTDAARHDRRRTPLPRAYPARFARAPFALRKGHCAYVAPLSTLTPGSSPGQALALSHQGCFAQLPSFPRRREPREKQSTPIKSPLPRRERARVRVKGADPPSFPRRREPRNRGQMGAGHHSPSAKIRVICGSDTPLPSFPRRREPREKQRTPLKPPLPRAISLPLPGGD